MRSKVTFLLLALNVMLFGYLVLSERPWSATRQIEENRRRVLGPEAANLTSLEIAAFASPGETASATLRLERRGDTWFLADPLDWPANNFAVSRILNELQFLEHETSFPVSDLAANGQTLADYGLEDPRLIVTARPAPAAPGAPAPVPFSLRIGDGSEVGNRLYILSPDARRIHVVSRTLFDALDLDLNRLRSDQLFTVPVFEARALTLQTSEANSARTRLRRDQNHWIFEAPISTRAAKTPVELLIGDLNALRVNRFLPASDERTGLATPRFRLTLEGNARRETLLLGDPVAAGQPQEIYARLDDRPALFTVIVPDAVLQKLDTAQTALRERRILDLDPGLVTSITLAPPEGSFLSALRIQKLDSTATGPANWRLASSGLAAPLRADSALVERLLRNLALLEAVPPAPTSARPAPSPFFSDAPSATELENLGFNRPERTITLELIAPPAATNSPVTGPTSLVLELGRPSESAPEFYARVQNQPFIYAIPAQTISFFGLSARSWRDRTIARLPETTKITRLVLRSATNPDAAPILDYTPSAEPPPPAVTTLLGAVGNLRASTFVNEEYPQTVPVDGVEQPWAYTLEATLDPATDGPFVLSLAERAGGSTQLAGSARHELVFTLEQPVLDALWSLLYAEPKP